MTTKERAVEIINKYIDSYGERRLVDTVENVVNALISAGLIKPEIKLPEKELHRHNSIPCYTDYEKEGCVTCIRNAVIDEIKRLNENKEMT